MKVVWKIAGVAGIAGAVLLLSGCAATPVDTKKYSFDVKKKQIVKYSEDDYYYRPNHSWSYKLDKSTASINAYTNNAASGGLLKCKENDIWFISMNNIRAEEKIRYRYFISLSKFELEDMKTDPAFIPRRDSKEFKDLIEIDTQLAQQGLIGCSGKIPKNRVKKIIPMSKTISIPSL